MTDEEYGKALKKFHKLSDRHIIVAETDMPYSDVLKVVALSDKIRKATQSVDDDNEVRLLASRLYIMLI